MTEFVIVSQWMSNGDIDQFVKKHWDMNGFELVKLVDEHRS